MPVDPANPAEGAAAADPSDLLAPIRGKWGTAARRLLAAHPRFTAVAWFLVLLLWAGSLALAWLSWFVGLSELWSWALENGIGYARVWRVALALIGSIFLFVVPIWGWIIAYGFTEIVLDASVGDEKEKLATARERVRETEEDALRRLEKTDEVGLLPLLRYSRAQLDAYYAMGLGQTRRAFVNAALAMWLGFLLLVSGIALYIAPLGQFGIEPPTGDFNLLILASAVIIEVVSALFLWVYRSTIGQLTFYYRLQMQSHTAIMCFRIATTMDQADEAKRAVIDKLLGAAPEPERPEPMGAAGLPVVA